MKVNMILPFMSKRPVGGIKIIYQYADYLAGNGHIVTLYHACILNNAPRKYLNLFRIVRNKLLIRNSYPSWFEFKNKVDSRLIFKISNKTIDNGDAIFSTMYATALDVYGLDDSKGKKINVIQDYETWIGSEKELIKSYKLPITHIVINDYLFSIVEKYSPLKPVLVYNAIDTEKFYLKKDISDRNQHSICMMYSEEKRKGSQFGIEALTICKEKILDLQVTFFSVFPRPKSLPEWINFYQSPNNLIDIYNDAAIFFTPSLGEGWALPPAEAMSCGCALVCTDIGGHAAYGKNNQTALLVESQNVNDMAEKLIRLLTDNNERIALAENGLKFIQKFSWQNVVAQLESIFSK